MKTLSYTKFIGIFFLGFAALLFWKVEGEAKELGSEFATVEPPIEIVSYQNYAGLSELVTMICDDAIERFHGFYGPTVVTVAPFKTSEPRKETKVSKLGVTIADQMIAMINNDTLVTTSPQSKTLGDYEQKLSGVLQEVDGYLRVHISGRNVDGKRISYVANVEMSEPIYRALHTYL